MPFVNASYYSGTSTTTPTHQVGDLLIVVAVRWGSSTPPSLPSGWTSAHTGTNTDACRVGWKVASATNDSTGTWTNANALYIAVWRGYTAVGAASSNLSTANTAQTPGLTLTQAGSWVGTLGSPSSGQSGTPTGTVSRWTDGYSRWCDTDGPVSSWSAQTVTNQWLAVSLELIPAPTPVSTSLTVARDVEGWTATTTLLVGRTAAGPVSTALRVARSVAAIEVPSFEEAVAAPVRLIRARAELVDPDGQPVEVQVGKAPPRSDLPLSGGRVSFSGQSAEQWSAVLSFADPWMVPRDPSHPLWGARDLLVRVWWGVRVLAPVEEPRSALVDGFLAEYFVGKDLAGTPALVRREAEIAHLWASAAPASGLPQDNFSVRWTGTLFATAGEWVFTLNSDDGARLYVDDVLVVDSWVNRGPTTDIARVTLDRGQHTVRMEYYEATGGAQAYLSWAPAVGGGGIPERWDERLLCTVAIGDSAGTDTGTISGTVRCRDVLSTARGGWGGPLDLGGLTVTEALRAIFGRVAPTLRVRIAETTITLPDVYEVGEEDPAATWTKVAAVAGWLVRSARDGVVDGGPREAPGAPLDWSEGVDCPVSELSWDHAIEHMGNRVTVRSTHPDAVGVFATVDDTDPSSPTWVGYGVRPLPDIETDVAVTVEACQNIGRLALGKGTQPTEGVEVVVPQRPDLTYRRPVHLARAQAGIGGEYEVSAWDLDLPVTGEPAAPMPVRMMRKGADSG